MIEEQEATIAKYLKESADCTCESCQLIRMLVEELEQARPIMRAAKAFVNEARAPQHELQSYRCQAQDAMRILFEAVPEADSPTPTPSTIAWGSAS